MFFKISDSFIHPKIHLDIQFRVLSSKSEAKTIEYIKMFLKFVNTLVIRNKVSVVIRGFTIPIGCTRNDVVMETVVGKDVFPIPLLYSRVSPFFTSPQYSLPFPTILLYEPDWVENFEQMEGQNPIPNNTNAQLISVIAMMDPLIYDGDSAAIAIKNVLDSNQLLRKVVGAHVTTVICRPEEIQQVTNDSHAYNLMLEAGVELGTFIEYGLLKDFQSFSFSSTVSEGVDVIVLELEINFHAFLAVSVKNLVDQYASDIQWRLILVYRDWIKFQQMHPNRRLIILLDETSDWHRNTPSCTERAYCNSCVAKLGSLYEAILTWARIHNVSIVVKTDVFSPEVYIGPAWYEYLPGIRDEVVVARNQPLRLPNEENSCIHQTNSVSQEGIEFSSSNSGITVNNRFEKSRLKYLKSNELAVMTAFALHKFNLVEVLLEQDDECNVATNVEKALEILKPHLFKNSSQTRLFLDFPLQPVDETQLICYETLITTVSNVLNEETALSGVHISNWKVMQNLSEDWTQSKSLNLSLGITVDDCYNLRREVTGCDAPLDQVDYILCRVEYSELSNSNREEMSKQLDNVLYLSKVFRKLCPHLQVYFRLTAKSIRNNQERTIVRLAYVDFLKFLADWTQFTIKYNIPIFLTETVDHSDGVLNGWWHVSNWTDLANPQVYFDKEAELLNQPTWRPTFLEIVSSIADGPSDTTIRTTIVEGFVLIAIAAIVGITAVVVAALKFYGRKRTILTEEQIRAILDGDSSHFSTDMIPLREQEPDVIYDSAYEIPKARFSFEGKVELGSGHFGDVVKAQVGDEWVAVKKPNETCTRQGLISMLEEVKIMCHVGTHENVLRFVGCSTKHASTGVIYIATELCENGCLQKYLIDLEPRLKRDENRTLHLYQLNQFAFEIASGMEYITSKRIIHSDLATRNVLLDSNMTCKIGDFGLSRKLYVNDLYEKKGNDPMPWRWLAVESLKRREYSSASDVWSYGVTVWEIFSFGHLPYSEITSASGFAATSFKMDFDSTNPPFTTNNIQNCKRMLECRNL